MRARSKLRWNVAALCLACLPACGSLRVDIGEIVANPREYDGRTVTIAGEVTDSLNVVVVRAYTVRDATGEILVVTERAVPRRGEHVTVRGQVNQAFAIAGKSLVVIMEAPRK